MPTTQPTYAPMLAATSQGVPAGDGWVFEIKWDGYRAIARVQGDEVQLWSRNGKRLDTRYPGVAAALPHALASADCVLDGELCSFDAAGTSRFEHFQRGEGSIAYVVFDLLELDGQPLIAEPWSRRRERLSELIVPGAATVVLSQVFDDGEALLAAARRRGLEGVLAKRRQAQYRPGRRSDDWRKVKLREEATLRIAGYTSGQGARKSLGALVLATDDLEYAGNCGSGLSDDGMRELLQGSRRCGARRRRYAARRGRPARPGPASRGSSRCCRAKWSSPNGRASAGCARPCSSAS